MSKVSDRWAHAGVVEHSAHVHPSTLGRSSAFSLPEAPVDPTAAAGIWTVRAGVFPESTTSLAVHDTTGIGIAGK
ncbi:hypothetical protein ACFFSH_04825 [Streptomyces filamentosus]|uniref:Uncharacterized protein n=1 Tax=Streptomyces filamentosus TaxID=67294 RepID=A0A919ES72_STRFL|nr:hypothetical protein [Streptomyces filamentosus]GHG24021.1 hypothetical protein GCM10017667_69450 [Streptomyces filamentosus]